MNIIIRFIVCVMLTVINTNANNLNSQYYRKDDVYDVYTSSQYIQYPTENNNAYAIRALEQFKYFLTKHNFEFTMKSTSGWIRVLKNESKRIRYGFILNQRQIQFYITGLQYDKKRRLNSEF